MIAPWNIWWHNQQPEGARNGDNLASAADPPRGGYRHRRSRIWRTARRGDVPRTRGGCPPGRSEEHTSDLQSLMRISYAVFCLNKKYNTQCPTQLTHPESPPPIP